MWWIIIGGFIVFQLLTFDKDKLSQMQQQAQATAGAK